MSGHRELVTDAQDLIRTGRVLAEVPDVDLAQVADYCASLDQFGLELAAKGRLYEEAAAWCWLASGLLRGEDVPESIHAPADEDSADTARWQRWRLS